MRNVWPVLERELRVASRRPATWRLRWATGAVGAAATAACFWIYGGNGGSAAEAGAVLFTTLGVACGAWAMIAGCQRTADSIGRERRDGTLGLLFLTDLGGWDVVLGKLCAAGAEIAYQVLALVPMMAIPLLLGGVGPWTLLMLLVALANGLGISLTFGLLGSLWSRDPRQAAGLAMSFVLASVCFPWGLYAYLASRENAGPALDYVAALLPSPSLPFLVAVPQAQLVPRSFILAAVAMQSLATAGLLAFTARQVRVVWQSGGTRGWRARWAEFRDRMRFGPPAGRATRRARLLEEGAWVWLTRRERLKQHLPWLLVVAALGLDAWIYGKLGADSFNTASPILAVVFHLLIRLWVAGEAANTLGEQRSAGAMELLLTTPLGPAEILGQQGRALRGQLLWPWVALAVRDAACVVSIFVNVNGSNLSVGWWTHVGLAATAPLHAAALRWVSTWHVIDGRATNFAVGRALTRVLLFPALAAGFLAFQATTLARFDGLEPDTRAALGALCWIGGLCGWSWWVARRTRARVLASFRERLTSGKGVRAESAAAH